MPSPPAHLLSFSIVSRSGEFGRDRGPLQLVEHYAPRDLSIGAPSIKVEYRRDLGTGSTFETHTVSLLSETALLGRMPSWVQFQIAADACLQALVSNSYVRPGLELWQYATYVDQMRHAYLVMSRLGSAD